MMKACAADGHEPQALDMPARGLLQGNYFLGQSIMPSAFLQIISCLSSLSDMQVKNAAVGFLNYPRSEETAQ